MKHLFSIFCCLSTLVAISQTNTEVFLADLSFTEDREFKVSNFQNISYNEGYDNQPSFTQDGLLLYAKTQNEQTDIAVFDPAFWSTQWLFEGTPGGEYSPQRIGSTQDFTAVRLDPDGKQRLYRYRSGEAPVAYIKDLRVAYYAHYDENTLLSSVLSGNQLDLVISDIASQKSDTLLDRSGRSIHKVPATDAMSYTAVNEEGNWDVYQLDTKTKESFFVAQLPIGIQDHVWLDGSKMLIGSGNKLYLYDLFGDGEWQLFADLSAYKIENITRMAVSPDRKRLAIVAEALSPSEIVQAHIAPYNEGRLDDFANAFSENVVVRNFPADTTSMGRAEMRAGYERFMKNNSNLTVKVENRIAYKNVVVDEETGTVNNDTFHQATIYETGLGSIQSMTFIHNKKTSKDPTIIVDKQLEAYNARNIDEFMATYADDIKLYSFPHRFMSEGQASMKTNYASFFEATPDLNCTIKNRIVVGNKVIDEEFLTINGKNYSAIAIYEVENGLISKVTFIQ
ncbi:nuclear transport factor 2 family protein [Aureisphaera galaxeae]|uniref:nuclear transport factor 2 family protein n=1 Tax=Aureisphaera galaxeae TaxID=1538023 RepID=UPI002350188B|nr:nuclear transport factor 2 family protein [Aureisphaera galaxeae]MDC8003594.1 nuclear transport factor 2 family protein [Aureisphaera galaxeae]